MNTTFLNMCTAQARWDSQRTLIQCTLVFDISDWKQTIERCELLPVSGKKGLAVLLKTGELLGAEEDFGGSDVDYSDVTEMIRISLLDTYGNALITKLETDAEVNYPDRRWRTVPSGGTLAAEHFLSGSVGGLFRPSFEFILMPVIWKQQGMASERPSTRRSSTAIRPEESYI